MRVFDHLKDCPFCLRRVKATKKCWSIHYFFAQRCKQELRHGTCGHENLMYTANRQSITRKYTWVHKKLPTLTTVNVSRKDKILRIHLGTGSSAGVSSILLGFCFSYFSREFLATQNIHDTSAATQKDGLFR